MSSTSLFETQCLSVFKCHLILSEINRDKFCRRCNDLQKKEKDYKNNGFKIQFDLLQEKHLYSFSVDGLLTQPIWNHRPQSSQEICKNNNKKNVSNIVSNCASLFINIPHQFNK